MVKNGQKEGLRGYKIIFHDTSDTHDTFKLGYMQRA